MTYQNSTLAVILAPSSTFVPSSLQFRTAAGQVLFQAQLTNASSDALFLCTINASAAQQIASVQEPFLAYINGTFSSGGTWTTRCLKKTFSYSQFSVLLNGPTFPGNSLAPLTAALFVGVVRVPSTANLPVITANVSVPQLVPSALTATVETIALGTSEETGATLVQVFITVETPALLVGNLTSLVVALGVAAEGDLGNSAGATFVVAQDSDADGCPDVMEWGPMQNATYDGNSDGVPDAQQANVVTFLSCFSEVVTLAASTPGIFRNFSLTYVTPSLRVHSSSYKAGIRGFFPQGLVNFALSADSTITIFGQHALPVNINSFVAWDQEQRVSVRSVSSSPTSLSTTLALKAGTYSAGLYLASSSPLNGGAFFMVIFGLLFIAFVCVATWYLWRTFKLADSPAAAVSAPSAAAEQQLPQQQGDQPPLGEKQEDQQGQPPAPSLGE